MWMEPQIMICKSQEVAPEDTPADERSHKDARFSRPVRLATVKAQECLSKWVSYLTSELTDSIMYDYIVPSNFLVYPLS